MKDKVEYEEKDLRTHVYDAPDTYAGGDNKIQDHLPILKDGKIVFQEIEYIPVLYNMFNEGAVNARDHAVRLQSKEGVNQVTKIKFNYNSETNEISIYNDGDGILIEKHKSGIYNPELIFGRLLTSSNYKKDEKKIVGGKNGYGAKIINIFSTDFTIETIDSVTKQKYTQSFHKNMTIIKKPVI